MKSAVNPHMPPIFQPLIRILALEIINGCRNDSYVGGLAEFVKLWEGQALAANGEERQRIQRVAKGLSYYHRVPLDDRPHYVRHLLAIVESEDFVEALPLGAADNLEELLQRKEYLRSEIAKLDDHQQPLQAHLEELVQQKEHLRFEVDGLDAQRQQVLTSLRDVSQQAEELRSEVIEFEAQRLELQAEIIRLRDDQDVLRLQNQQLCDKKAELESAIATLDTHNAELTEHKTRLETDIGTTNAELARLDNLAKELRSKANEIEQKAFSRLEQINRLIRQKIDLENEISSMNRNLDQLKYEQASLHHEVEQRRKQRDKIRAKPEFTWGADEKSEEKQLSKEIDELNKRRVQLEIETANLSRDLEGRRRQRETIDAEMNS